MRFGIDLPPLGRLADPRTALRLAREAEDAGWDAVSTWDHAGFAWGVPAADPFVLLSAVATATERVQLVLGVLAMPRRRPWLTAQAVASLDLLSGGRVVVGAGAGGVKREFEAFGEDGTFATRASLLDEGLDVLDRLLRGEAVDHTGPGYRIDGVTLAPLPVRRPRPPIWIGAHSPAGYRRAGRWDGWLGTMGDDGTPETPERVAEAVAAIRAARSEDGLDGPYDVATLGVTEPGGLDVEAYAAAGVTWWFESLHPMKEFDALVARVRAGPPTSPA
jgi:alkanesulfonate monooxygenase SsuD/methylene tetrahydromethanopterin reductase-like flavin-dependent oxidoreductase (luciferase family)